MTRKCAAFLWLLAAGACQKSPAPPVVPPVPAPTVAAPAIPSIPSPELAPAEKPAAESPPVVETAKPTVDAPDAVAPPPQVVDAGPPPETPESQWKRASAALAALPEDGDAGAACVEVERLAPLVPTELSKLDVQRCADFKAWKAPTCDALIDKGERCHPAAAGDEAPDRESLISACQVSVAAEPTQLTAMAACLVKSCDAYGGCIAAARNGALRGRRVESVKAATASGEFKKASFLCAEQVRTGGDPAVIEACRELATQALQTWRPQLEARRTSGGDPGLLCFDFERLAGVISVEEGARARDLCAEVHFGGAVRDAMLAAAKARKGLPYECKSLAKQLESNGSAWALAQREKLALVCKDPPIP